MNNGTNPVTGDHLIDTAIDFETAGYDQIFQEYSRLMHVIVQREEAYWNAIMLVHNSIGLVHPFLSALLDGLSGPAVNTPTRAAAVTVTPAYVISCGMVNVANSLAAIKKNVFDEERFSLKELREAVNADFRGFEDIQKLLLSAPKFGNDDDYVDRILVDLYDEWSDASTRAENWVGDGSRWQPSTLSVTTQVLHGKACGASPDGRNAQDFLSDGALSAFPGTDEHGPTALIRSATKIHVQNLQSTLFNMKFNPSAIEGELGTKKFIGLIDTYFALGGYQVQYNIVDKEMLLDAQKHPNNYNDLMVRVAGFTAKFVTSVPMYSARCIERTQFECV